MFNALKTEKGVTLLELMVAVILAGIIFIFGGILLRNFSYIQREQGQMEQVKKSTQMAIQYITSKLENAYKFFSNGSNYIDKIVWSGISTQPPPCSSALKLPDIDENLSFNPSDSNFDTSAFGNAIFFAAITEDTEYIYDVSYAGTAETDTYLLKFFRFNLFYLGLDQSNPMEPDTYSLALMKWESERYADFNQLITLKNESGNIVYQARLDSIIDFLKTSVGIDYAWDTEESDANAAFYDLNNIDRDDPENSTPDPNIQFDSASVRKVYPKGTYGTIAVAFNASSDFPIKESVPLYTLSSGTGLCRFPNGFEVAIGGRQPGRKILLRITLATWGRGRVIASSYQTITTKPEY